MSNIPYYAAAVALAAIGAYLLVSNHLTSGGWLVAAAILALLWEGPK